MPSLEHVLSNYDLAHLRVFCELWELEPPETLGGIEAEHLAQTICNSSLIEKIVDTLPRSAVIALQDLLNNQGRLTWAYFSRRYGKVREVGAAHRDREQIYQHPQNAAETLWFRALISRDFFDTPEGLQEFAYIPSDLLAVMPELGKKNNEITGRKAKTTEYASILNANDDVLDHACTLLAWLRCGNSLKSLQNIKSSWPVQTKEQVSTVIPLDPETLYLLLQSAELIDHDGKLISNHIKEFLEISRDQSLAKLVKSWLLSGQFNELRFLTDLIFEGDWKNDPLKARYAIIEHLLQIPDETWWSTNAFIEGIKSVNPDFQRQAGDYDSWFIRDASTNQFLRGYANWDKVDGRLIHYIINGPLHWLGLVDLASPSPDKTTTAFRFTKLAKEWLKGNFTTRERLENAKLTLQSNATILIPRLTPRSARYQISRFCIWEGEKAGQYFYRITPSSLENAISQGLQVDYLLSLLKKHASTVPPALIKAIHSWMESGSLFRMEQVSILRVRNPKLVVALRKSKASRFLEEDIGPTVVKIKPGSQEKILAILAELGYLGDIV
jgi:hypothetical protein